MNERQFKQLKIILYEHDKVWSYCPWHNDIIRPNLSISLLSKYYGRYRCWACGKEGQLSNKQISELNLSNNIHKNSRYNLQTRWRQFNQSCYDNLQRFPLLKLGLAKQLNVSIRSLNDWLVGYDGCSFTIPMFRDDLSEYSGEDGFCGIQRRFPDYTKRCITGSRLGLMYPHKYIDSYYIFICEGFSDAISVWDLGFQVIARPHCRYIDGIRHFLENVLEGIENVIIIPDNDAVGYEGAEQLQKELNGLCYYDEGGEVDCNINIFFFDDAKDVRRLIQLKGKDYVKRELENYI